MCIKIKTISTTPGALNQIGWLFFLFFFSSDFCNFLRIMKCYKNFYRNLRRDIKLLHAATLSLSYKILATLSTSISTVILLKSHILQYLTHINLHNSLQQSSRRLMDWGVKLIKAFCFYRKNYPHAIWKRTCMLISLLYLGSVWISLIAENWKHCSKIIFKCVNSVVRRDQF